jgi:hypothetical protein
MGILDLFWPLPMLGVYFIGIKVKRPRFSAAPIRVAALG